MPISFWPGTFGKYSQKDGNNMTAHSVFAFGGFHFGPKIVYIIVALFEKLSVRCRTATHI
jgi:hypothetical protein